MANLRELRGQGSTADGLIRAEVEGTGRLVDLMLEPAVLRMSPIELANRVKVAVNRAQEDLAARVAEHLAEAPSVPPDQDRLARILSELAVEADRRTGEFSTAMDDLLRQVGRR